MKNKIEEIIKIKYSIFIKGTTMIFRHYLICILSILLAMSSCKQADYFAVYKDGVLQIGKYTEKEADELVKQEQYMLTVVHTPSLTKEHVGTYIFILQVRQQ